MYSVCVICPTDKACGGCAATDERAAERYACYDTAILVSKDLPTKKIKYKHGSFFRQTLQAPAEFHVEKRWSFEDKDAAFKKLKHEARNCGHFVRTHDGWVRL